MREQKTKVQEKKQNYKIIPNPRPPPPPPPPPKEG